MPTVPPLISGGVMLTYRCTNACKHCAYRCSPTRPDYFMPEEMIDRTFAALAGEGALHGVHLAGGEATLHWDRLEYAVRSAGRHGVDVDYLETNVGWCDDFDTACQGFERLRQAGLTAVLISASLFHNEFTPLERTKAGILAAQEVFGPYGVIVWTPVVLRMMEDLDASKTHPLHRSCELLGLDPKRGDVWRIHDYLTPGGRTTEKLTEGVARRPAGEFAGQPCRSTLESTTHFHIDSYGNLFTGHCPGIAAATIENLHPEITEQSAPVYFSLWKGGPHALWKTLAPDFDPDPAGYISRCHLCLDLRQHLRRAGVYQELRPNDYYD
ncbi:MAG: radical SAM protein [Planctomycetaceae bacterium]|nr:radical SAM protein [Planctomycetaceae bacterium]